MFSNILEHHGRANQRLVSLEEDLVHSKREEEKLKATIEALEKEKSEMNAKVALMERKDLYELLEAKMEGFQIANHLGTIEVDIVNNNDERRFAILESIFDSYVNPTNDPNVQPLVKELDADDFSVDKFFGLQDPTSPDDVQVSPDFEEDLRTNERYMSSPENEGSEDQGWPRKEDLMKEDLESAMYKGRYLRGDVINMYINERFLKKPCEQLHNMFYVNTFWFTKANELMARYDKTNHVEEAMIKIARLRKSICPKIRDENMQRSLLAWIFVPIHGNNHWSLAIIRIHNDVAMLAHLDSFRGTHDLEAIFHVLRIVLCLTMPIDPALVQKGIMNVEQQQDGHSCGKHVLQMLVGAAKKESEGLDRCFREEGLRYIATLDQVRSFDVLFPMYLSGKLPSPPI
ncbi:hypothetical protein R1flu_026917 [Riccia fluitans]|uniref:Ubiquitin-like protease family profile domain-containing protein n=1 Tax=Riccia fluitans TaxID=41844 RepID=A0ABD1XHB8_9MARC